MLVLYPHYSFTKEGYYASSHSFVSSMNSSLTGPRSPLAICSTECFSDRLCETPKSLPAAGMASLLIVTSQASLYQPLPPSGVEEDTCL